MPPRKAVTAAALPRSGDRQRFDRLGQRISTEAKPTRLTKQRHRRGKVNADLRSSIPHVNANALAVTDGTETVGFVVERIGAHFAFGPDQKLIGKFSSRAEAVAALPRAS